jgi:hypothetical protein
MTLSPDRQAQQSCSRLRVVLTLVLHTGFVGLRSNAVCMVKTLICALVVVCDREWVIFTEQVMGLSSYCCITCEACL